jgi:hypothetical protein
MLLYITRVNTDSGMTVIEALLSSPLTTPLWNSTFDANMNVRYWGYVGRTLSARKVHQNISCGILHHECRRQSGQSGPTMPNSWKALLSIPAVIAIALPIVNYSGLTEKAVDQKGNGPGS